jgi:hypothetical protein
MSRDTHTFDADKRRKGKGKGKKEQSSGNPDRSTNIIDPSFLPCVPCLGVSALVCVKGWVISPPRGRARSRR